MPFTFPDPNVQTTVTAPNGEVWHYIDGDWTVVKAANDDQAQIDELNVRLADISEEVEENEESLEALMPGLLMLRHELMISVLVWKMWKDWISLMLYLLWQ